MLARRSNPIIIGPACHVLRPGPVVVQRPVVAQKERRTPGDTWTLNLYAVDETGLALLDADGDGNPD